MEPVTFLLFCFFYVVKSLELDITPFVPKEISEGDSLMLTNYFRLNISESDRNHFRKDITGFKGFAKSNKNLVEFVNETIFFLAVDEIFEGKNVTVELRTKYFGFEKLDFELIAVDDSLSTNSNLTLYGSVELKIVRHRHLLDIIFLAFVSAFMFINNINIGCILDPTTLKEVFRKPIGPLVGIICQFIFMPLASYGIGKVMLDSDAMRLGLFTLGCSPGGSMSNFWTYLFESDVNLSVTMTFISTVAAFGMMPLWLFTLGQNLYESAKIEIPYSNLIITLILFTIPVGIGIILRRRFSKWSYYNRKLILPFTVFLLLYFMSVGIYTNLYLIRRMTWKVFISGAVVAWGGYLFGLIASFALCMTSKQAVAVSLETGIQNPGIAFVILKLTLVQPNADIASVAPVAQLFITHVPLWVCYVVRIVRKARKKRIKETKAGIELENETEKQPGTGVIV